MPYFPYLGPGFSIASEIELVGMKASETAVEACDVRISVCSPFPEAQQWTALNALLLVCENGVRLHLPQTADFYIFDAREVFVDAHISLASAHLSNLLENLVLGLLAYLRGNQVVHATGIEAPSGVVLLAGNHANGKSSLAYGLSRKANWPVLSDGMSAITQDNHAGHLLPVNPLLRVWGPVLEHFKIHLDTQSVKRDSEYEPRYRVGHHATNDGIKKPLRAIYFIEYKNDSDTASPEILSGSKAVMTLISAQYAKPICSRLGNAQDDFFKFASLAEKVSVVDFSNQWGLENLSRTVDQLYAHISELD